MLNQDLYSNNITRFFFEAAAQHPANLAIIESDREITYSQLAEEVKQTAAYFQAKGIVQGDRVLVFVPMSIDLYRSVLALFHIGATAVFLDEWVSRERLKLCSGFADCKGFLGTRKVGLLRIFTKEIRNIPVKLSLKGRAKTESFPVAVQADTSALITFTTGSTGMPKAADRTHAFLTAQFEILKTKMNCRPGDVDMPVLPIVLFINLGVGATSVIANYNSRKPDSLNPDVLLAQLVEHQVNRVTASPYVIKRLAERVIEKQHQTPGLKQVFTGGAPVFPAEARIYQQAFPGVDVRVIYGSTEAEPISSIGAEDLSFRVPWEEGGLAVGEVHPLTELRIVALDDALEHESSEEAFRLASLGEGRIGEIVVSGEHVLKQYFRNPKAMKDNKIKVGDGVWHRTGDSGFLKGGELFLTGRCRQLIMRDGKYLSPFVVEQSVQQIGGVTMWTILEQDGLTYLVLETSLKESELGNALQSYSYDQLLLTPIIPRDPRHHSKVDYGKLKSILFG